MDYAEHSNKIYGAVIVYDAVFEGSNMWICQWIKSSSVTIQNETFKAFFPIFTAVQRAHFPEKLIRQVTIKWIKSNPQQLDETISIALTKLAPSNCNSSLPQLDENKKEKVSDNFHNEWTIFSLCIKKHHFFNWKKKKMFRIEKLNKWSPINDYKMTS